MGAAEAVHTAFDAGDMHDETSGYLGRKSRVPDSDGLIYTLDELVGPQSKHGFQKHSIPPGCTSVPIIDKNNTVIGVLVGPPKGDKTWEDVTATAAAKLDAAEKDLWFDQKRLSHKRGKFPVQPYGFSFGGGQEFPKRIYHTDKNEKILKNLTSLACFKRLAGHANGAFATWAPDLYRLYCDYDSRLREKHPDCTRNFPNSIWACATYNFGPKTVTVQHLNHLNYLFGWCAITALGNFDYTRGGHFVLWELELVLKFPPGWTVLLPSAYIRHSNTPVSEAETRYSFTQYSAGGLFRWVDDGFRLRTTMTRTEKKAAKARDRERLHNGLNMYSTLDDLRSHYEKK
ncbi:hypothetical protein MPER_12620 [Moniliophthora perniciosa FA553]|nr:hypothetical protein MPER_12620 [Moniliophthora perniciosa FA553]